MTIYKICHIIVTSTILLDGVVNMDQKMMKKLNRQGLVFALLHTVIILNLAVDLEWYLTSINNLIV